MIPSEQKLAHTELLGRLKALMLLRVIFVTLLLGASIFIQIRDAQTYFGYIQKSHYIIIAAIYGVSLAYVLILRFTKTLTWFAYLQLLLDTLFVTAIIYATGGIESIFSVLYVLTIFNGSIMLYRKGGLVIASSSSILYGLLMDLHYYDIIHPLGTKGAGSEFGGPHLFYMVLVNIIGFYVVAYLSSYLTEQARKSRVELKAKQRDIDNLEVLNQSIINSMTSGLVVMNGGNHIVLFNPAAEEIFGMAPSQVTGRSIDQALPFLQKQVPDLTSRDRAERRIPPFIDLPYDRPDGETLHLRLSLSPLRLVMGEERGHLLIFQDITKIKQIEEEMKKVEGLALVGELAAGVAHEIRNPMASISGSIQMLREKLGKDDVNNRLMDIVSREISRLNNLVNDFLLFARPKQANRRLFDLNAIIQESLELFRNSQHWNNKIGIVTELQGDTMLDSDPDQLKQTFWNLYLNACEAMPEGGALYVTTTRESPQQGDLGNVIISVRDSGKGFEDSVLPHLFVPFFTTKEQGSGLGLAIVKRIVDRLRGEVWGANHPQGGAVITIRLPLSYPAGDGEPHHS
jgi:two-component system sensor histidine kinase PilS (NtrC family)